MFRVKFIKKTQLIIYNTNIQYLKNNIFLFDNISILKKCYKMFEFVFFKSNIFAVN